MLGRALWWRLVGLVRDQVLVFPEQTTPQTDRILDHNSSLGRHFFLGAIFRQRMVRSPRHSDFGLGKATLVKMETLHRWDLGGKWDQSHCRLDRKQMDAWVAEKVDRVGFEDCVPGGYPRTTLNLSPHAWTDLDWRCLRRRVPILNHPYVVSVRPIGSSVG